MINPTDVIEPMSRCHSCAKVTEVVSVREMIGRLKIK